MKKSAKSSANGAGKPPKEGKKTVRSIATIPSRRAKSSGRSPKQPRQLAPYSDGHGSHLPGPFGFGGMVPDIDPASFCPNLSI